MNNFSENLSKLKFLVNYLVLEYLNLFTTNNYRSMIMG